jgi:hypothetical protein
MPNAPKNSDGGPHAKAYAQVSQTIPQIKTFDDDSQGEKRRSEENSDRATADGKR